MNSWVGSGLCDSSLRLSDRCVNRSDFGILSGSHVKGFHSANKVVWPILHKSCDLFRESHFSYTDLGFFGQFIVFLYYSYTDLSSWWLICSGSICLEQQLAQRSDELTIFWLFGTRFQIWAYFLVFCVCFWVVNRYMDPNLYFWYWIVAVLKLFKWRNQM